MTFHIYVVNTVLKTLDEKYPLSDYIHLVQNLCFRFHRLNMLLFSTVVVLLFVYPLKTFWISYIFFFCKL